MDTSADHALDWARRNGWFIGCVMVLTAFAVGFEIRFRNNFIHKLALPLKRDLGQLDRSKLTFKDPATGQTFKYELAGNPIQLPPEMVNTLGTDQYLEWPLRLWLWGESPAERKAVGDPFEVFVTYYTGKPDQVPHVPEVCMLANGFNKVRDQLFNLELPGLPEKDRRVDVQALLFHRGTLMDEQSRLVMYTFRVCDQWHADRDRVRFTLGNPLARYAYFSKVEISLPLSSDSNSEAVAQATEAGKRFLQVLLPVLVQEHWPAWPSDQGEPRSPAGGK